MWLHHVQTCIVLSLQMFSFSLWICCSLHRGLSFSVAVIRIRSQCHNVTMSFLVSRTPAANPMWVRMIPPGTCLRRHIFCFHFDTEPNAHHHTHPQPALGVVFPLSYPSLVPFPLTSPTKILLSRLSWLLKRPKKLILTFWCVSWYGWNSLILIFWLLLFVIVFSAPDKPYNWR